MSADQDAEVKAVKAVKALRPDAHFTYHHPAMGLPGGWMAHEWGRPLSGEQLHSSRFAAAQDALARLGH